VNTPFKFFMAVWTFEQALSGVGEFDAFIAMGASNNDHARAYSVRPIKLNPLLNSGLSGLADGGFSTELRLLFVDLASEEGHNVEDLDVGVGFVALKLEALKVRDALGA
jgi:hypothetical protein